MSSFRIIVFGIGCVLFLTQCERKRESPSVVIEAEPSISALISTFLDGGESYKEIRFAEVIEASCGNRVIPLDPNEEVDSVILDEVSRALDASLEFFNRDDSPTNRQRKISDVSSRFEAKICEIMDAAPGIRCARPRTKSGILVRSGYPDLRMVHEETGRVFYLVPKLVETGSLTSSLRTFYFSPRGENETVLDDAHHLLVGIEHDGKTGAWKFPNWHLVDLANFKVRIKAEFQASNKDLYMSDLIIRNNSKSD